MDIERKVANIGNNTIVGQLKELYKKLGGTDADASGIHTIAQAIDKIEDIAGSGVGSVMCVTVDIEDGTTYTADVSYADVVEAFESGMFVLFKVVGADGVGSLSYDEEYSEVFGGIIYGADGQLKWDCVVYTAEGLTLETKTANITWS